MNSSISFSMVWYHLRFILFAFYSTIVNILNHWYKGQLGDVLIDRNWNSSINITATPSLPHVQLVHSTQFLTLPMHLPTKVMALSIGIDRYKFFTPWLRRISLQRNIIKHFFPEVGINFFDIFSNGEHNLETIPFSGAPFLCVFGKPDNHRAWNLSF